MPPTLFIKSIRFRLTILYTAILSAVLIGAGVGLFTVFSNSLIWQSDQRLKSYADQLAAEAVQLQISVDTGIKKSSANTPFAHTATGQQYLFDVSVRQAGAKLQQSIPFVIASRNGSVLLESSSSNKPLHSAVADNAKTTAAQQNTTVQTEADVKGQSYRVLAVPVHIGTERVGVLEVADNISHIQDTLDLLFFYMKVAIPLVLLLAAALSWFLVGHALAPVAEIRRLASEISVSDLSKRLHIEGDDELAQLAATFDGMIDRLEQAFVRQKQFTSDASHELRTPLAVMQADFSLALRRPRTISEYEGIMESAQEEISRMSAIVEDLSMLARMDSSKMVLDIRDVSLDDLLADLVSRIEVLAADKSILLTIRELFPLTVQADARLLKQLVLNLLNNAIAYTPPHGQIEVRMIALSKSEVAFHVRDTGVGIPDAALPHIFERFYRVDASRQRNPGGSGLGLAICQSIVMAHGGSIGVHSIEGKGTTFSIVLPVAGPLSSPLPTSRESEPEATIMVGSPALSAAAH